MTRYVAWVVMVQLVVGSAHADPVEDDASARLERGVAAYRARDFARAMNELLEANRLAPEWPDPYRWLALVEAEVDDCQSALINLETFVARVPAGDPRVPELVALRDRCLHTGKLSVESTPSGAAVRIDDGPPIGTTPARLTVRTGPHRVSLEKPGFEPQARGVDVGVGGIGYASFALTAAYDPPLSRRWWFWTAIGAVAVTAIGLTYEATRSSGHDLPGVTCSAAGCHP